MQWISFYAYEEEWFGLDFFDDFFRTLRDRQILYGVDAFVFLRFFGWPVSGCLVGIVAAGIDVAVDEGCLGRAAARLGSESVGYAAAGIRCNGLRIFIYLVGAMDGYDDDQFVCSAFCFRSNGLSNFFDDLAL